MKNIVSKQEVYDAITDSALSLDRTFKVKDGDFEWTFGLEREDLKNVKASDLESFQAIDVAIGQVIDGQTLCQDEQSVYLQDLLQDLEDRKLQIQDAIDGIKAKFNK